MKRFAVDALLSRVIDEADAGQLPIFIDEWLATEDARHWIARALRIDLPVLVERPELVVPCLLRRCTWFGAEYPRFVHRAPPPPDAAAVRGLTRSWEASWTRPYLRSLRTPQVPLDGGVVEEYRSGAAGPLWLTASHVGLGDDVAWDRASGRRMRMTMPAARERVWKLEKRELVSGAHVLPLPIDADYEPSQLFELDDELAIVTARYDDPYGDDSTYRTYCIELRTGRCRFELDGGCSAAARHGDTIYMVDRGAFGAWSIAGEVRDSATVAGMGLVFASDGTFATRTEQVIRIYDPARMIATRVADSYLQGLFALSPDSTRAITGQVLCDAHTGEQLAQLQFDGIGNWLEGGPPRNCRALCDDVVAEILPFGYRLWDSTTGEVLVDDRDHRADARDAVAFASNGRAHVIVKRGGAATVYDNHSLRVLHESALPVDNTWRLELRLSHDASTLSWRDGEAAVQILQLRPGKTTLPPSPAAAIRDGIVTLGELALPIDDAHADVSADGTVIVGRTSHYVRG